MNKYECNESAIEELCNRNLLQAQRLFRCNSMDNPCHISFNNLGWFYCEYGLSLNNGGHRSAEALGLRYLKKAAALKLDAVNQENLGQAFMKQRKYEEAYTHFILAYDLSHRIDALYNSCVALFCANRYQLALDTLARVRKSAEFVRLFPEKAQGLPLFMAFCLFHSKKFSQAAYCISQYTCSDDTSYDTIALYSLLKDEGLVFPDWRLLLQWFPTTELCEIVAICIIHSIIDVTKDDYQTLCSWSQLGEISLDKIVRKYNSNVQQSIAKRYRFIPTIIESCGFYGCKLHKNGYP